MLAENSISVALIVKNEARCLARCLQSVQAVVCEIGVVDTGSTDDTVRLARSLGAKVAFFHWVDDFAAARNYALDQTRGDWILVLDADEYATPALAQEVREFAAGPAAVGRLKILSEFQRKGQIFRSQSFVSRLFPRGARFEGRIHEQLQSPLPRVDLQGELLHDGYLEGRKSERNIELLNQALKESPNNSYLLFQLALEYASLNDPDKAFFVLREAFELLQPKDAFGPNVVVDYLYAIIEKKAFETGLAVIRQSGRALDAFPDFHLVCGLFYMDLIRSNPGKYIAWLPKVEQSFQRCLALGDADKFKSVRGTGSFLAHYNLGTFYHVFGNAAGAISCFENAARLGYEPAKQMLRTLSRSPA